MPAISLEVADVVDAAIEVAGATTLAAATLEGGTVGAATGLGTTGGATGAGAKQNHQIAKTRLKTSEYLKTSSKFGKRTISFRNSGINRHPWISRVSWISTESICSRITTKAAKDIILLGNLEYNCSKLSKVIMKPLHSFDRKSAVKKSKPFNDNIKLRILSHPKVILTSLRY